MPSSTLAVVTLPMAVTPTPMDDSDPISARSQSPISSKNKNQACLRELNDLLKDADVLGLEKTRSRQQKRNDERKSSKRQSQAKEQGGDRNKSVRNRTKEMSMVRDQQTTQW